MIPFGFLVQPLAEAT